MGRQSQGTRVGLWAGFHVRLCSSLMKSVATPLQMWGDPECVWLSQVWKGLVPMLDGRGPGPRKPHQARHNPGRGAGDGQWGQGGGGHGRTHGPVEKAPMHTPGPERFGAGCAPLCPLGRDRQASLRLAACFLDDSTSCVLPVRQETAPA